MVLGVTKRAAGRRVALIIFGKKNIKKKSGNSGRRGSWLEITRCLKSSRPSPGVLLSALSFEWVYWWINLCALSYTGIDQAVERWACYQEVAVPITDLALLFRRFRRCRESAVCLCHLMLQYVVPLQRAVMFTPPQFSGLPSLGGIGTHPDDT